MGVLDCKHMFCTECIKDWAAVTNTCPLCKQEFICIKRKLNEAEEFIPVMQKRQIYQENIEELVIEETDDKCYRCFSDDDNHIMLVCDRCLFYCCHTYCCDPPLDAIPSDDWICDFCRHGDDSDSEESEDSGEPQENQLQSLVQERNRRRNPQSVQPSRPAAGSRRSNNQQMSAQNAGRSSNQQRGGRSDQRGRGRADRRGRTRRGQAGRGRDNLGNSFTYRGNISRNRNSTRTNSLTNPSDEENQGRTSSRRAAASRPQNQAPSLGVRETRSSRQETSSFNSANALRQNQEPLRQNQQPLRQNQQPLRQNQQPQRQNQEPARLRAGGEDREMPIEVTRTNLRRTAEEESRISPRTDSSPEYLGRQRMQMARRPRRIIDSEDEAEENEHAGRMIEIAPVVGGGRASAEGLKQPEVKGIVDNFLTAEELMDFFSETRSPNKSVADSPKENKSPNELHYAQGPKTSIESKFPKKSEEKSPPPINLPRSMRKFPERDDSSSNSPDRDEMFEGYLFESKSGMSRRDSEEKPGTNHLRAIGKSTALPWGSREKGQKNKQNIEKNNGRMSSFIMKHSKNVFDKF